MTRISASAIVIMAAIWAAAPAQAQNYDPDHPICLHVFTRGGYYRCIYDSMEQCKMSASGRAAMCESNPYYVGARRSPASKGQRSVY